MMKEVTIYTASGAERLTVRLNSGAKGKYSLGKEDYVTLPFTLAEPVIFETGDWCDLSGLDESLGGIFAKRYEVADRQSPSFSNDTGGYGYELRLDAYYMAWKNKIFRYYPEDGAAEASWCLTAELDVHMNVFLRNLNALGYKFNDKEEFGYEIDHNVVEDKALLVTYDSANLVDALTMMAEAWECDWWVTDNMIHFGRCEDGEAVDVEIGKAASSMERSDSDGTFANRVYAFGSDRNVPLSYRKRLVFSVTQAYGVAFCDGARPLRKSYFADDDIPDKKETAELSGIKTEEQIYLPYQSSGTWEFGFTPVNLNAGSHTLFLESFRVRVSLVSQSQEKGSKQTGFTAKATVCLKDSSGDKKIEREFEDESDDDGPIILSCTGYDGGDGTFYISETDTFTLSVLVEASSSDSYSRYLKVLIDNGTLDTSPTPYIVTERDWPNINAIITFHSGALEGQTYPANMQYGINLGIEDYEIIISAQKGPAIGDTFTIDNILSSLVPVSWLTSDSDEALVNGIVSGRLRLPEGTPYVDAYRYLDGKKVYIGEDGYDSEKAEEMPIPEAVETVVVTDDIYPRTNLRVKSVSKETVDVTDDDGNKTGEVQTYYRVKVETANGEAFTFKSDYIISGQDLGMAFTSGLLNGMEFLVDFKADTQEYELVLNDDYGRTLPDTVLYPRAADEENGIEADTLVLYGWDSSFLEDLNLVANAERELLGFAVEYVKRAVLEDGTFTVKLYPAWVYEYPMLRTFRLGQRINLINGALFPDGRVSRVIGVEAALDIPCDSPTYTIGESFEYSRLGELEGKLDGVVYRGIAYGAGTEGASSSSAAAGTYLIKTNDRTAASDSNAYSAKRALVQFLRRDTDESTAYSLDVGGNLTVARQTDTEGLMVRGLADMLRASVSELIGNGDFLDGFFGYGWQMYKRGDDWCLTLDSLTVRKSMNVYELVIQKIRSVGGQIVVSAANGRISSVMLAEDGDGDEAYILAFEDVCGFMKGDLIRCQRFTGVEAKMYWVEVSKVESGGAWVKVSEFEEYECEPEVGDDVVTLGNTKYEERQNFISISATEDGQPRIEIHNNVSAKTFSLNADEDNTLRAVFGNLDGITDSWFGDDQPEGDGLYANNVFLKGRFLLKSGEDVETRFEVTEGMIASAVASAGNAASADSWLSNGFFADGLSKWTASDASATWWQTRGLWLKDNEAPLMSAEGGKGVTLVEEEGVIALCLENAAVKQYRSDMTEAARSLDLISDGTEGDGEDVKVPCVVGVLSFRYKCEEEGELTVGFPGFDTDGVKLADGVEYEVTGTFEKTDGWEEYSVRLGWDTLSRFSIGFTGRILLSGVTIVTDAGAQSVTLATRIEQTEESIKLLSASVTEWQGGEEDRFAEFVMTDTFANLLVTRILKDTETGGNVVERAGLVTTSNFAKLFVEAVNGNDEVKAVMAAYVTKTDTGEKDDNDNPIYAMESNVIVKADQIRLEGYTTINEHFTVDDEGKITATEATISGTITASSGKIGGFTIDGTKLTAKNNNATMTLSSEDISFVNEEGASVSIGQSSSSYSTYSLSTLCSMQVKSEWVGGTYNGNKVGDFASNIGIRLNVSGAHAYDDYIASGNHALYIDNGDICGFRLRSRVASDTKNSEGEVTSPLKSVTLDEMDSILVIASVSDTTVTLPASPQEGQVYWVMDNAVGGGDTYAIYITGNANIIFNNGGSYSVLQFRAGCVMLAYSKGYWYAFAINTSSYKAEK